MTFYAEAKKIISVEIFDEESDKVTVDTSLVPYLRKHFLQLCTDVFHDWNTVFPFVNEFVLYPGCSTDIVRAVILTKARTLVGLDIVDTSLYPSLEETPSASKKIQNITEMVAITEQIARDLKFLRWSIPEAISEENAITYIDMTGNKLTVTFDLFGLHRQVIVYVGVDANTFVPVEVEGKKVDVMFHNAYTPDKDTIIRYQPHYVMTPLGEFYPGMSNSMNLIQSKFFDNETYSLLDNINAIMKVTNTKNPLILAKAHLLRNLVHDVLIELHKM